MHSIRALTIVQALSLVAWGGSMIAWFVVTDSTRYVYFSVWVVAMILFFVSFRRARWLATDPRRQNDSH